MIFGYVNFYYEKCRECSFLNIIFNEKIVFTPNQRNLVIDYFNLCAEEFLWYKKNRIPNDVWSAWKSGIQ
jgi:hypothetical protein